MKVDYTVVIVPRKLSCFPGLACPEVDDRFSGALTNKFRLGITFRAASGKIFALGKIGGP